MADTYKSLGQSKPSAATLTTLYTVPSSTSAIVSTIKVCNLSAAATTFRLAHRVGGAAIEDKFYFYYDEIIPGNSTFTITSGITLATTDIISVYATLATVTFNMWGVEKT
jgi:hypothetical protein